MHFQRCCFTTAAHTDVLWTQLRQFWCERVGGNSHTAHGLTGESGVTDTSRYSCTFWFCCCGFSWFLASSEKRRARHKIKMQSLSTHPRADVTLGEVSWSIKYFWSFTAKQHFSIGVQALLKGSQWESVQNSGVTCYLEACIIQDTHTHHLAGGYTVKVTFNNISHFFSAGELCTLILWS